MHPGQHRETARILLYRLNQSSEPEFFLLKTHFDPEVGLPPRWITPGGGIDDGETIIEAAIRELKEETGLEVTAGDLGDLVWQTEGKWRWGDGVNHHTFVDYFYQLKVADFEFDDSGWTDDEHRDVLVHRWWSIAELNATNDSVGPPGLVDFIRDNPFS